MDIDWFGLPAYLERRAYVLGLLKAPLNEGGLDGQLVDRVLQVPCRSCSRPSSL